MKRFMRTTLAVATIAVLAPSVHAAVLEMTQDDLNIWQSVIDEDMNDSLLQRIDEEFATDTALFPLKEEDEATLTKLEAMKKERTNEFVSIEHRDGLLILSDVPRNSWFAPYVRDIAERGIVSGYKDAAGYPTGTFGPADNVTVEQMAKVMVSMVGISVSNCPAVALNGSASGSWSVPYLACAEAKSWSVYVDGSVDVHRNASRAEVVVTLLQAYAVKPDTGTGSSFTDVMQTMQYGSMIEKAKIDGIISGYVDADGMPNGLFGPGDPVTRAEFAKIVSLGMQVYAQ
jgi:hypothetical protein